jgi:hypothetical protein
MMKRSQMKRFLSLTGGGLAAFAGFALILGASPVRADGLRMSTLGNCSIALLDENNGVNPYDFSRNPASLLSEFGDAWVRMTMNFDQVSGELKRPYDPLFVDDSFIGFEGRKRLNEGQVIWGRFTYDRLWQRELSHSLEIDQYNDPFYLTDHTTGDILYYGPTSRVDYALRLTPTVTLGAGFDYDISTGLKDVYTRPQIVHNYFKGNLGLAIDAAPHWLLGFTFRPMRIQNRTDFDKTDEGYDNQIFRYAGDAIYEVRSFSTYSIRELLWGGEGGVQSFITTTRVKVGMDFTYGLVENKIKYNATNPEAVGFWQDQAYNFRMLMRYTPVDAPLVLGVSAQAMNEDGWARRPRFPNVLLYDNPIKLRSAGAGASYLVRPLRLLVSGEYVLNAFEIDANDYGANSFTHRDVTQNIGRLGLEYAAYNVFAVRAGIEATDYLIDRWLKLPANIDRYRFSAGGAYTWHFWQIEAELLYARGTRENDDRERTDLGGILWFTRSE